MKTKVEQMAIDYCSLYSWNDPREEDAREAYIEGFRACIAEAEKMARVASVRVGGEQFAWLRLDDLKKLVGEG